MSKTTTNTPTTTTSRTRAASAVLALLALTGLSACGTDAGATEQAPTKEQSPGQEQSGATPGTQAPAAQASGVSVSDAWVKSADQGMSAAFGVLTVEGAGATVVSATTPASAAIELHETVPGDDGRMMMREKTGGFALGDGEDLVLEPGGNHLMLMGITDPLEAGETVTVELTMADGSVFAFDAPVKDFSGANESYAGDPEPSHTGVPDGHGEPEDDGGATGHGSDS